MQAVTERIYQRMTMHSNARQKKNAKRQTPNRVHANARQEERKVVIDEGRDTRDEIPSTYKPNNNATLVRPA
jgi:hypothetical protein